MSSTRSGVAPDAQDEDVQRLLTRSFLFSSQPQETLASIARLFKQLQVDDRQIIFLRGQPGDRMYAIVRGSVKISVTSEQGREIVFGILGPGEFFGEMALLNGLGRCATATAVGPTELLSMERSTFLEYLLAHPQLAIELLQRIAERLRMADMLIEDNAFLNVPARLAKKLLHLAETYGSQTPKGLRIGFRLSQQDLANLIGATRESVNKLIRLWCDHDLLARERGGLVLRDIPELKKIATI